MITSVEQIPGHIIDQVRAICDDTYSEVTDRELIREANNLLTPQPIKIAKRKPVERKLSARERDMVEFMRAHNVMSSLQR